MVKKEGNLKEKCPRCAKGKLVTDNESGETFCSKCGFVLTEKLQEAGPYGVHLLKTNLVIGQELVLQQVLQCMTWVLLR